MIKVSLDEGGVYDMLAILEVKLKMARSEKVAVAFARMCQEAAEQISTELHLTIMRSTEYRAMLDVNERLFVLVDKTKFKKEDECFDQATDSAVYERFLCKKALQERFFPEVPLTEVKLGYDGTPAVKPTE